jgi:hypothetical protein
VENSTEGKVAVVAGEAEGAERVVAVLAAVRLAVALAVAEAEEQHLQSTPEVQRNLQRRTAVGAENLPLFLRANCFQDVHQVEELEIKFLAASKFKGFVRYRN